MAAPPLPVPPVGAGGAITLQNARRAVGNALRTTPTDTPFQDNGATQRLKTALQTYIINFEQQELQNDPTTIHNLQCDIAIWGLRHWPITVTSDETRDLVKEYRFNYRKTGMPTSHPTARVARLIADRLLLIEAFEKAKEMGMTEISDYYGSKRNLALQEKIYSMWSDFSIILIEFLWYRPLLTSKDRTDYTVLLRKNPSYTPTPGNFIAILTDIYCPPYQIVQELDRAGCTLALFATQIFPRASLAGCHFDHMTYVNHNGIIHQAPGSQDHEWPATYVNDEWVTLRGFHLNETGQPQTWEWDSWMTVHDYKLYRLLPTPGHLKIEPAYAAPTSPNSYIETRVITPTRWKSILEAYLSGWLCRPTIFNRPLKVFLPALEALATKYINKTRQTFQESNCQTEVGNIIDKKEYKAFWAGLRTNSNITKEEVALDTATYIFWGNLENDYKMRRRTAESLGDTWRAFKNLKQNLPTTGASIPWPLIIASAAAIAAMCYYHRNTKFVDLVRQCLPTTKTTKNVGLSMALESGYYTFWKDTARSIWNSIPTIETVKNAFSEALQSTRATWTSRPRILPTDVELERVTPTVEKLTDTAISVQQQFSQVDTRGPLVETIVGSIIVICAPIYEEYFKTKCRYRNLQLGGMIIGMIEGLGNPIFTAVKIFWHCYVNNLPNNVLAHHSWNAGVSLATNMGPYSAGNITNIARYGIPLHLAAIFSQHRASNFRWFSCGFAIQFTVVRWAQHFLGDVDSTAPAGLLPEIFSIALFSIYLLSISFAIFTRRTPSLTNEQEVKRFREDYANVESHLNQYPTTMALTYQQADLPAITETQTYPDAPIIPDVTDELVERPSVYVLLGTTSMMYRPYGFNQFYHAYKQRNVIPCLITPTCEIPGDECELHSLKRTTCPIGAQWRCASNWTITIMEATKGNIDLQVVPLKSLEWIKHFNGAAKKQRAHDGIEQRNTGFLRKETNVFLKGDEVLYGRQGFMKPRTIKALHPTVQATCYKEIAECMDRLKIIFNENQIHQVGMFQVTFAIGSGKTSSELNTWFASSKEWVSIGNRRAAVIVAGDDFFSIVREKDEIFYLENDFAKFDRTQGVHAQDAEAKILKLLGMSERVSYILFSTMNLQPRYENKRLDHQAIYHMPAQRATGAPDTTIGNTINNIISVIYAVMNAGTFNRLAEHQANLGLEAKLQRHTEASTATFLKGWWLPCEDEYYWLPLPSQTIKMGKILTLPTQIFKHLPEDSAWRSAAKSMGASYKNVPFEYPLFGPQLQRYAQLEGEVVDLAPFQPNDGHKIVVDEKAKVDKYTARVYIANRYNISYEDIVNMEEEMLSMPFPGLACHPGWAKVVEKDYG